MQMNIAVAIQGTLVELLTKATSGSVIELFHQVPGAFGVDSHGNLYIQKSGKYYRLNIQDELVETDDVVSGIYDPKSDGYTYQKRGDRFSYNASPMGEVVPLGQHPCDEYVAGRLGLYLKDGTRLLLLVIKP